MESLLQNPLLVNELEFAPYRVYRSAEKAVRVYSEWMSGNSAWDMQVSLDTRLRSDFTKTSLSDEASKWINSTQYYPFIRQDEHHRYDW